MKKDRTWLSKADAGRIVQKVAVVTRSWKDRARSAGRPAHECDRMANAFEHEALASPEAEAAPPSERPSVSGALPGCAWLPAPI